MLLINNKTFKYIYKRYLEQIKSLIKNLLKKKIYNQSQVKNIEKELVDNLTEEEKSEFDKLIKLAEEKMKAL